MEAKDVVTWALEASIYFDPRRPGLTVADLIEIGALFGVTQTAIELQVRGRAVEGDRVVPFGVDPSFFVTYPGDLRNVGAFDYVFGAFKLAAEEAAGGPVIADREAIVASGVEAGLPRADLEHAIALYRAFEGVPEAERRWEVRRIKPGGAAPSAQREGPAGRKVTRRERYAELVDRVRLLMEKRGGGRAPEPEPVVPRPPPVMRPESLAGVMPPPRLSPALGTPALTPAMVAAAMAAPATPSTMQPIPQPSTRTSRPPAPEDDPLTAFRLLLPGFGQQRLSAWWGQLSHDLRSADESGSALARCVLAATMLEVVLTMACPRPRDLKPDPKGKPARWGLLEMAKAARSLGVDENLRARIEKLYKLRQRIHVSRVLESTGLIPDVTADEAREAGEVLSATIRLVLAWNVRRRG